MATKKELRDFVEEQRSVVVNKLYQEHTAKLKDAEKNHLLGYLGTDMLMSMYISEVNSSTVHNEAVELMVKDEGTRYHDFYRKDIKDFGDWLHSFTDRITIKEHTLMYEAYEGITRDQNAIYKKIQANLNTLTAKQGVEYLSELGFDFEEKPVEHLPMVQINTNHLIIPEVEK